MEAYDSATIRGSEVSLPPKERLLELQANAAIRYLDASRGKRFLMTCGYNETTPLYKEYDRLTEKKSNKADKVNFTARFILSTYRLLKLKEVKIYYVEEGDSNLYKRCSSFETLRAEIALYYQILFGMDGNIDDVTKAIENGILPKDLYSEIDRDCIQICDGLYWSRKNADILTVNGEHAGRDNIPNTKRAFAKMFDTDVGDKNIFIVPKFDEADVKLMLEVYDELKDTSYYDWPDKYHFQCFKDWSRDNLDISYGMMTVPALPFMRILPRGSIFNDGDGHNGKSVLNGLAISIIGKNNVSMVEGSSLGDWDHLVNFQTTWLNIPNETTVDFLQNNTEAFKAMSAQETIDVRKKHGDASISVNCDFPMVFNINKLPNFSEDASAVLSRMFINKFEVDFEAEGRVIKDYAKKTFLADKNTMPTIVGAVLAFAHYYSQDEHLWTESESMVEAKSMLAETAVPRKEYFKWFSLFFDSFSGIKIVKNDFISFGIEEGDSYDGSDISMKQRPFCNSKRVSDGVGTYYKIGGEDIGVFKRFRFSDTLMIRKYMGSRMSSYQSSGNAHSLVHAMREDYLSKRAMYDDKLKAAGVTKTEQEKHKYVMQQMWVEISKEGFYE